ncbi:MAG: ABC transporter substrate-binding protein, partial [Burkholderiaceae bacterium]|nr:ABC transporter substrate-binding protein [Burkholderiaceae bacterium]
MAVTTSFKRGATDFSSQMQKLASEKCDMVVLGTIIRETIGGIATARRMGFNPIFLGSSAAYTDLIHKLGKGAMDGLYATMSSANPYLDAADQNVSRWAVKYKTAFNEDPTVFSVYGYNVVDTFAEAATQAGKNLTPDTFVKAMETMKISNDIFGSPTLSFGPKKRLGSNETRLSQLQKERWVVISPYASLGK